MSEQQRPRLKLRSRLLRLAIPGVQTVAEQAVPYAGEWVRRNEAAIAGEGPVWVVLGDSMSQGIGATCVDGGWVPQMARNLAALGRPYRVLNLSRSGVTTEDVEKRQLPELLAMVTPPALVTLLVGANDMLRPPARRELESRLTRILDGLPQGSLVARLPQPVRLARAVNARIEAAAQNGRIRPVDMRPAARSFRGHRAADFFHPNDRGYARIAEVFTRAAAGVEYPPAPHSTE